MRVSREEIAAVLDDLLSGRRSRESAERWAEDRMRADDASNLAFDPVSEEQQLRAGIHFLLGVGLRDSPTNYLHSDTDLREYLGRLEQ
jgi:hypothetical protein